MIRRLVDTGLHGDGSYCEAHGKEAREGADADIGGAHGPVEGRHSARLRPVRQVLPVLACCVCGNVCVYLLQDRVCVFITEGPKLYVFISVSLLTVCVLSRWPTGFRTVL